MGVGGRGRGADRYLMMSSRLVSQVYTGLEGLLWMPADTAETGGGAPSTRPTFFCAAWSSDAITDDDRADKSNGPWLTTVGPSGSCLTRRGIDELGASGRLWTAVLGWLGSCWADMPGSVLALMVAEAEAAWWLCASVLGEGELGPIGTSETASSCQISILQCYGFEPFCRTRIRSCQIIRYGTVLKLKKKNLFSTILVWKNIRFYQITVMHFVPYLF
jgi:hypothetical protein